MANGQGVGIGRIGFSFLDDIAKNYIAPGGECIFFQRLAAWRFQGSEIPYFPCRYNVRVGHKVLDFRFD